MYCFMPSSFVCQSWTFCLPPFSFLFLLSLHLHQSRASGRTYEKENEKCGCMDGQIRAQNEHAKSLTGCIHGRSVVHAPRSASPSREKNRMEWRLMTRNVQYMNRTAKNVIGVRGLGLGAILLSKKWNLDLPQLVTQFTESWICAIAQFTVECFGHG